MVRPKVLILLSALVITACIDTAGVDEELRYGHYTLHRMNGELLPATFTANTIGRVEFLRGSLWLHRDGSFSDSTEVKVTTLSDGAQRFVLDVASGMFRISNDTLYLNSTRGEQYHMRFQVAGSLTQELSGSTLVYRK